MAYLEKEKPFINPEFSIDDLAKNLDLQKHHLYYCFNSILQIKFTSLRTKLRVNHAKEILLSGDLTMMSMEGIWTKAGFSSRTNFFVSFKEETGLTPLEFIKNKNLGNLKEN
jgi:transcriptional regulator GlxA family with amidase domain